jgi:O-methyltransferase involved in polyketide biosynthesis
MDKTEDYRKISSTAAPVVYGRMFSDIPYSKEIAEFCQTELLISDAYRTTNRLIAPYIEARFRALTNLLAKSGIKNIIEVASGLSQRGLIMTEDKTISYVETDLPDMIREKEGVIKQLLVQENKEIPTNLHFSELNVLDEKCFKAIIAKLPDGPVAIGNEGFLAHLTREERTTMGKIIRGILSERGGTWITPDIFTSDQLKKLLAIGQGRDVTEDVIRNTGRNYHDNAFKDIEDAQKFFHDLGFTYSMHTLGETAGELASVRIGLDGESVKEQLALNIWELR